MNTTIAHYYTDDDFAGIAIYEHDADDARASASEIIGGSHADAELAMRGGDVDPADLTDDQRAHLKRHGWCYVSGE